MAINEALPYWADGDFITGECTAAVTGKRFLSCSGISAGINGPMPLVAHTAAGKAVFGVSGYDAAIGAPVNVAHDPAIVMPVTVGAGGVTAGDGVVSDATGQAVKAASGAASQGMALATVAAGADCPIDRSCKPVNP